MEELKKLFNNTLYIEAIKKCDSLLKKKPLSWDDKYDVLLIKLESQYHLGLYEECKNTLQTAGKIKLIYNYYYWQGLLELKINNDLIKTKTLIEKSLHKLPFRYEKERGRIYGHLAVINAMMQNFKEVDILLDNCRELAGEDVIEYNLQSMFYKKEFNKIIKTYKRINNKRFIIFKMYIKSLIAKGYVKKAYNKISKWLLDNQTQEADFFTDYFHVCFSTFNYETALQTFDKIQNPSEDTVNRKNTLLRLYNNTPYPESKKDNPRKAKFFNIYHNTTQKNNYLPSAVYSLIKNCKMLNRIEDVGASDDLHDKTIFKILKYLKEKNVNFTLFKFSKTNVKKLLNNKIPFVYITETPSKLEYNLICGYDSSYSNLIARDKSFKTINIPRSKENKLTSYCLLIADQKTITKAIDLIDRDKVITEVNLLIDGINSYYKYDYYKSLDIINEFIAKYPDFPEAISLKFSCYINLKEYENAQKIIEYAKEQGLKNKSNLFKADLNYFLENFAQAKKDFRKCLNRENSVYALKGYAKIFIEEENYKKALEKIKSAYVLNPLNRDTIIQMGIIYTYIEEYNKAWDFFNIAILMYEDSVVYDHAGWAASRQEDWIKAQEYFEKSKELNPENYYTYYQIGYILRNTGNAYKAISYLEKSLKLNNNDPWIYSELGNAYELIKQYRKAIQSFLKVIELGLEKPYYYAHIGSCYGKIKSYDKAVEYLNIACQKDKKYLWAIEELTFYLRQKGDLLKQRENNNKYKKYYEEAIKYLNNALKIKKDDFWLHNEIGYAKESLGEYNEAVKNYKKSLKIQNNDYSNAHIGFCHRNLHRPDKAIPYFKKAIKLNSGYFWAISELAYCYEIKKQFNLALKMYYDALSIKPDDAYCTAHIGYIYLEKALKYRKQKKRKRYSNELNKAVYFLKQSISIDSNYTWALAELGYALRLSKKYKEAINYLEKASDLNQRDEWIFNELGYCYEQTEMYNKASQCFIKVIGLDMNNSYAYAHLGHVSRLLNDLNQSILYLIKAIRLNPKYNWAITELGISLREKGWYKTALGIYKKAFKVMTRDSWLLNDIAYCYEQIGFLEEAERFFMKSTEVNLNDDYPIAHLGSINMQKGNYDEAEYYLKKAVTLNPSYNWAHSKLAEIYERKNNFKNGIELISGLLNKGNKGKDLLIRKAFYQRKNGEYKKAIETLSKIDKSPSSLFETALNYWLLNNMDDMHKTLNKIIKSDKKISYDTKFWEKKAKYLIKNEETIQFANIIIEKALNINADDYNANITKGDILIELNKNELAIEHYRRAIKNDKNNYIGWLKITNVFLLTNQNEKSALSIKKALELEYNDSFVHSMYARVLIANNYNNKKVLFHLKHAVALNHNNAEANFLLAEIFSDLGFNQLALPHINKYLFLTFKGEGFLNGIKLKTKIKKALKV